MHWMNSFGQDCYVPEKLSKYSLLYSFMWWSSLNGGPLACVLLKELYKRVKLAAYILLVMWEWVGFYDGVISVNSSILIYASFRPLRYPLKNTCANCRSMKFITVKCSRIVDLPTLWLWFALFLKFNLSIYWNWCWNSYAGRMWCSSLGHYRWAGCRPSSICIYMLQHTEGI